MIDTDTPANVPAETDVQALYDRTFDMIVEFGYALELVTGRPDDEDERGTYLALNAQKLSAAMGVPAPEDIAAEPLLIVARIDVPEFGFRFPIPD